MVNFNDKIILVTGGTGSIGEALIIKLLENYSPKIIRIFSRDETKQHLLAKKLSKNRSKLRLLIGDIRDRERLKIAMRNVDIVFHLAALKHVTACEYNPFEAIKTNIIGLQNLIEISMENNVEKVLFTSTDKAATPSNTMGVTKLLGEKLITAANFYKGDAKTIFYSIRFGNVLGSRGSLIPLIENQIKNNIPITLTHTEMTRYIMSIEKAIELILLTLEIAQGGEVFVFKMNAVKIIDLIDVLIDIISAKLEKKRENVQIKEIGMFAGEKLYEELFSIEESMRTYETENMYIVFPQLTEVSVKLNHSFYPNLNRFDNSKSYNSKDGPFLTKEEIKDFLIKNNII
ncbi:MAG: polysaccharide biosynthesis protein [Promethearchaeota archaeon]